MENKYIIFLNVVTMNKFNQLSALARMSGLTIPAIEAQTHNYQYLYNTSNDSVRVVDSFLLETYSPFQFSFDENREKCFLTDAKGIFTYSYIGVENEMPLYKEDKPGFCGYRFLYFTVDYLDLQWNCPEDYILKAEKKSIRHLRRIDKD